MPTHNPPPSPPPLPTPLLLLIHSISSLLLPLLSHFCANMIQCVGVCVCACVYTVAELVDKAVVLLKCDWQIY